MWPDRGSNPRPLALESGALPTTLLDPALINRCKLKIYRNSVKSSQYWVIMKDCVQGNPVYDLKVFRLERNSTLAWYSTRSADQRYQHSECW